MSFGPGFSYGIEAMKTGADVKLCPKCGSEMERRASVYTLSVPERWVCKCGYEEKVGGDEK